MTGNGRIGQKEKFGDSEWKRKGGWRCQQSPFYILLFLTFISKIVLTIAHLTWRIAGSCLLEDTAHWRSSQCLPLSPRKPGTRTEKHERIESTNGDKVVKYLKKKLLYNYAMKFKMKKPKLLFLRTIGKSFNTDKWYYCLFVMMLNEKKIKERDGGQRWVRTIKVSFSYNYSSTYKFHSWMQSGRLVKCTALNSNTLLVLLTSYV